MQITIKFGRTKAGARPVRKSQKMSGNFMELRGGQDKVRNFCRPCKLFLWYSIYSFVLNCRGVESAGGGYFSSFS